MYAKIFLKIFDSSIAEDWQARIVFQDILILANRDGVVDMTHEAISRRTNVPLEIVRVAIGKLESPDVRSNTPEDDGRRLERIADHKDWGWRVINYERYRAIRNTEEMRTATRERVAAWRAKKKKESAENVPSTAGTGTTPPTVNEPPLEKKSKDVALVIPEVLAGEDFSKAWSEWCADRKERKKPVTKRAAELQLKDLAVMGKVKAIESIRQSIANGWAGLFDAKSGSGKMMAAATGTVRDNRGGSL